MKIGDKCYAIGGPYYNTVNNVTIIGIIGDRYLVFDHYLKDVYTVNDVFLAYEEAMKELNRGKI